MLPNILKETVRGIQPILIEDEMLQHREVFLIEEVNRKSATDMIKQLMYLDRIDTGKPVILDDFAANVYIEDFDKLISVIRSRNISVSVILQSLTQLQSMYSKEQADTIVTNCDHLLYLGGQDIETARYIGYRSNKTEDHILLMPIGKAYLIERGKLGIMVDRVPPYEIERQSFDKENQKDSESWYETADELIFA